VTAGDDSAFLVGKYYAIGTDRKCVLADVAHVFSEAAAKLGLENAKSFADVEPGGGVG
jgi:hypothetical protein